MSLMDEIRSATERGFVPSEYGAGPPNLEHLVDDEVYEMLSSAEPLAEVSLVESTSPQGAAFEVAYGHSMFVLGRKVYFKWVEQRQNYRCTDLTVVWSNGGSYSFAGRDCSGSGRTIYQFTRWK